MKAGLRRMIGQVTKRFKSVGNDLLLLAGAGLVCYGAYLIYHPSAFILAGGTLIYWAIQIERGKPNGKPN